jgi:hypothetical protein
MSLVIKIAALVTVVCVAHPLSAQEHHDHSTHTAHDMHEHHGDQEAEVANTSHDGHASTSEAILTRTEDIESALAEGGEPIVADVLGVVCDFCAVAMNKIFGKREEVAAIYVDLDTKALSLVLVPGASLSDETIAELAVQAGYRIAEVRRGDAALGQNA